MSSFGSVSFSSGRPFRYHWYLLVHVIQYLDQLIRANVAIVFVLRKGGDFQHSGVVESRRVCLSDLKKLRTNDFKKSKHLAIPAFSNFTKFVVW